MTMDWQAIASILGERTEKPLVLLDRAGRVQLVNRAMEKVLGWSRFEIEGQYWADTVAPPDRLQIETRWIAEALRGAFHDYETTVMAKSGSLLAIHLDLALVGRGTEQALLATVRRVRAIEPFPTRPHDDLDYDISVAGEDFGQLLRMTAHGESLPLPDGDRRCFVLFYDLPGPCHDCPVLRASIEQAPQTTIRPTPPPPGNDARGEHRFEVITATPLDKTAVRLRIRTISESTLGAIHEAKMQRIAEKGSLSEREYAVLRSLLMGRSIEDIAGDLEITPRTVKYHQANVLQKVGADSRVDLLRLIF
jgi:PAS domain S-box-containing protein